MTWSRRRRRAEVSTPWGRPDYDVALGGLVASVEDRAQRADATFEDYLQWANSRLPNEEEADEAQEEG
ncbi:MAG: hypothetical protein GEV08_17645 [Acidimicrobiia bacterium]|nr:hypothetical protein [Acidimicrobiia bacterium]